MTDTTPEAPATPETPAQQPPEGNEPEPTTFDADYVAKLRSEAAKYRTEAKTTASALEEARTAQQQQLDAIAKALGFKSDAEAPDPEKLAAEVSTERQRAREAATQLAVYRSAAQHGGNPDALLDSASFLRSLADVDPGDGAAVAAAIKAAVGANPRLAAVTDAHPGVVGIGVGGTGGAPTDPRAADVAQIEADLARNKRR